MIFSLFVKYGSVFLFLCKRDFYKILCMFRIRFSRFVQHRKILKISSYRRRPIQNSISMFVMRNFFYVCQASLLSSISRYCKHRKKSLSVHVNLFCVCSTFQNPRMENNFRRIIGGPLLLLLLLPILLLVHALYLPFSSLSSAATTAFSTLDSLNSSAGRRRPLPPGGPPPPAQLRGPGGEHGDPVQVRNQAGAEGEGGS